MIALQVLGIRSQNENLAHHKVPPQFMMELYNIIADSGGVTQGRNPYNAKIVRSFIERGNSLRYDSRQYSSKESRDPPRYRKHLTTSFVHRLLPVALLLLQHLGSGRKRVGAGGRVASLPQENAAKEFTSVDVTLLFGKCTA